MPTASRLSKLPWERIAADLDLQGWATTGPLLSAQERKQMIDAYGDDDAFRTTVVMARHGFGRGEYRYFGYPLPELVQSLRTELYERLLPTANRWRAAQGAKPFPASHAEFLGHCHSAGQTRPTHYFSATGRAITTASTRICTATGCSRCKPRSC
jgi:uncharacterized protein